MQKQNQEVEFKCKRCGECCPNAALKRKAFLNGSVRTVISSNKKYRSEADGCRQPGFVYLKLQEADKIAKALHMDTYQFNERFCDLQDRQRLVLKKNADERCIFLTDGECSIYSARPQQCRDFPVLWRTERSESYCEGLKNS